MRLSQSNIDDLCHLLFKAFLEIRGLGSEGKAEQVAALADAFHNLPVFMLTDQFDWDVQRQFFDDYCTRYQGNDRVFDYVLLLSQIRSGVYKQEL